MNKEEIEILIVDDSALYRLALRKVLESIPGCNVVGQAVDGKQALEKIQELSPHLVTLDIEMPEVNGIQVLRQMKARGDEAKVIVLSKHTQDGAQITVDALLEGAFDVICKPALGSREQNQEFLRQELESRINALADASPNVIDAPLDSEEPTRIGKWNCSAVVIGCSTGGPEALRQIVGSLPENFPIPVVIVQHIPPNFSASLANRLNGLSPLEVVEVQEGMLLESGTIFLAPGGRHVKLNKIDHRVTFQLTDDPPENSCRPAVDYTLRSAVEQFDGQVLAVILTGMGRDGLNGCQMLSAAGGRVIAQHAQDCIVYGMPKAVIEAGIADRVLPISQIPKAILQELNRSSDDQR